MSDGGAGVQAKKGQSNLDLYYVDGDKDHTKGGNTIGAAVLRKKPD